SALSMAATAPDLSHSVEPLNERRSGDPPLCREGPHHRRDLEQFLLVGALLLAILSTTWRSDHQQPLKITTRVHLHEPRPPSSSPILSTTWRSDHQQHLKITAGGPI